MDYNFYAQNFDYFKLVKKDFKRITAVLTNALRQFQEQFFNPNKFYLFGFSLGAQIVIQSGRNFGHQLIYQIDGKV